VTASANDRMIAIKEFFMCPGYAGRDGRSAG
jgi:hypothetical protein